MPNVRIRDTWDAIIRQEHEDNPDLTAPRLWHLIVQRSEKGLYPSYPPSLSTVRRSLTEVYDHEPYRRFCWPETMENGALPWEASAACLELLSILDKDANGYLPNARPTINLCRWFWWVTLAAPTLRGDDRYRVAVTIATRREIGRDLPQGIDMFLGYSPWIKGGRPDYEKATTRQQRPVPHYTPQEDIALGGKGPPSGLMALNAMFAGRRRQGQDFRLVEEPQGPSSSPQQSP